MKRRLGLLISVTLVLLLGYQAYLRGSYWLAYYALDSQGQSSGLVHATQRSFHLTDNEQFNFVAYPDPENRKRGYKYLCGRGEFEKPNYLNMRCYVVFGGSVDVCPFAALNTSCRSLKIPDYFWDDREIREQITNALRNPCQWLPDPYKDLSKIEKDVGEYGIDSWGTTDVAMSQVWNAWHSAGCSRWPVKTILLQIVDTSDNNLIVNSHDHVIREEIAFRRSTADNK